MANAQGIWFKNTQLKTSSAIFSAYKVWRHHLLISWQHFQILQ